MRVSVTGANGFLGSRVVPLLIERGYQVAAPVRSVEAADNAWSLVVGAVSSDLDDPSSLRSFEEVTEEKAVGVATAGSDLPPSPFILKEHHPNGEHSARGQ